MRVLSLLLAVALASSATGCLEIPAARIAKPTLDAKGWKENATAARSDSSWGGLARTEQRVFEHPRASDGSYGGQLSVVTIRAFFEQSEEDLRDRLQEAVRARSEAKGIKIDEEAAKGERENGEGRKTTWFTYKGKAQSADTLFTRDAEIRIVGEVWNCRDTRTVVVAVGLAQMSDVRSIGGIPVPGQSPDARTWNALVADSDGTIDGATGTGLLDSIACS